jgi:hypothetical protein
VVKFVQMEVGLRTPVQVVGVVVEVVVAVVLSTCKAYTGNWELDASRQMAVPAAQMQLMPAMVVAEESAESALKLPREAAEQQLHRHFQC